MKSFWVVFCVSVCGNLAAHAVLVSGYAYLSGQSDHGNIRVIFEEVSPSAETDTTYTNDNGYFAHVIEPGVYNIIYSHDQFATYRLPNQILLSDHTFDTVVLLPPLSGHLNGWIGPGDFQVVDSIVVDSGQTLTIMPGTRLFFEYRKRFLVYGLLTAVGTETDSIVFTRRTPSPDSLWGGLRFIYADSLTRLEYCVVEYARSPGGNFGAGGGILIAYCNPTLTHCTVRFNVHASGYSYGGGGICCVGASPHIENSSVVGNSDDGYAGGGGIHCSGGAPLITNCVISQDTASVGGGVYLYDSAARFVNCDIIDNLGGYGAGGAAVGPYGHFERCRIANNRSTFGGGGISARDSAEFVECLIEGNRSTYGAGGVHSGTAVFNRCTIANNRSLDYYSAEAVYFSDASATFTSCVLVGRGTNPAILFSNSPNADIRYCDIFAGDSAAIGYSNDDPSNAPLIFGLPIVTNANGDSCDTYYNIFMDPQFADTANGDYHLMATSPCIDAGDPELEPDPDGTVADMGAFYFNQLDAPDEERTAVRHYELMQNYPNPFNSATRIEFNLPRAGNAELTVYDVTGRMIKMLAAGPMAAGHHEVLFDAGKLPSGIYFYQLDANAVRQTRKMVLIR